MKISHSWLCRYFKGQATPEQIAETLTATGLEVENLEKAEAIPGGLAGVVVAQVLTCEKHPDADKLHLTTVDVGTGTPLNVVCGAPNVRAGLKTMCAQVGTKLTMGDQSITIKRSKIRGAVSEGMLCAEDELGIGTSHAGIMELPADAPVGQAAKEYLGLTDDYQYEIGLTPNRIDAASHYGVARDLAAGLLQRGVQAKLELPSVDSFSIDNTNTPVSITVEAQQACTRYAGLTISNISVKPSPEWLQSSLRAIGLTPINNVVDVTNFVLHEIGQPLHAFDLAKIDGQRVVVRTMPSDTPFVTLDGQERKLHADDLMICNANAPMCIAGVFGGLESGISESTTSIFLESACFNPVYVRKTARRHALSTDASFRFERGVDPNITIWALKRAALLIKEVAGGQISSDITDIYPTPVERASINFSPERASRLIGIEIDLQTIERILDSLEIDIESRNSDGTWTLRVPTYRVDVTREADVVEEILRIFGYNNVPMPAKLNSVLSPSPRPDSFKVQNIIANYLTSNMFNEIMCNSLTKEAYYTNLSSHPAETAVHVMNPLSSDLNVMRQTLLFGGLESIQRNISHRNANLKLYEFGNCYSLRSNTPASEKPLSRYHESLRLGIWLTGQTHEEHWATPQAEQNFFHLKGYVNAIIQRMGIALDSLSRTEAQPDLFAYGMSYALPNGQCIAQLGLVNPERAAAMGIKTDVFYAELEWMPLLKALGNNTIKFNELPKYPAVRRDLALLLDKNVAYEQIKALAFSTERNLLKQVNLFDVYQGKNLPEGKKSLAVSFILQDERKTLVDAQIERTMQRLVDAFTRELGAQLR